MFLFFFGNNLSLPTCSTIAAHWGAAGHTLGTTDVEYCTSITLQFSSFHWKYSFGQYAQYWFYCTECIYAMSDHFTFILTGSNATFSIMNWYVIMKSYIEMTGWRTLFLLFICK